MSLSYIFWPQEGLQGSREQAQKCLIGPMKDGAVSGCMQA